MGRVRVGHFATTDGREPALVPVCFVVLGDTLYHAIDAKPKSTPPSRLRRVRNVRANPSAAFLIDHYEEDWGRLWYALLRGRASVLDHGPERQRAIDHGAARWRRAGHRASCTADIALASQFTCPSPRKPDGSVGMKVRIDMIEGSA
ncbi:MAG: hypothetical protein E6I46_07225 [Chloroflexi bacterium]|nr:MAG: hypothetical protein E6I46_07225 [Chloroflexota bacterium]